MFKIFNPSKFNDLIGLNKQQKLITACVLNECRPSTYIFYGDCGTGKSTFARFFAKSLNCCSFINEKDLCCNCEYCIDSNKNQFLIEYDAYQLNTISIEKIIEDVSCLNKSLIKTIVFDNFDLISPDRQTHISRIFDMVNNDVLFVINTTNINLIINSLQMRSLNIEFNHIKDEDMFSYIKRNYKDIDENTVKYLIHNSQGTLGKLNLNIRKCNLVGIDKLINQEVSFDDGMTNYIKSLITKDKELAIKSIDEILLTPTADIKYNYQNYLYEMIKDSFLNEDNNYSPRDKIISLLKKQNKLLNLIRLMSSDWVINSFYSQITIKTSLLALFQHISKV